jgi:hypothetical protein
MPRGRFARRQGDSLHCINTLKTGLISSDFTVSHL